MSEGRVTIGNILSAVRAFLRLVRNPHDLKNYDGLEQRLMALATERDLAKIAESYRRSPETGPMLASRYLGPTPDIASLLRSPEGSLGNAYAHFIADNNLSADYYPHAESTDDLAYFKSRMLQLHDIWHVLIGAPPNLPGELQVIGFTIGQLERTLRRERIAIAFLYMMTVAYLVNSVVNPAWKLADAWRHFRDGRRQGLTTRPLFAIRWEEMWGVPLERVRALHVRERSAPSWPFEMVGLSAVSQR